MCGEHLASDAIPYLGPGSSPHVRGTLATKPDDLAASGIIPACAGNTPATGRKASRNGDHPRMCGEHEYDTTVSIRE